MWGKDKDMFIDKVYYADVAFEEDIDNIDFKPALASNGDYYSEIELLISFFIFYYSIYKHGSQVIDISCQNGLITNKEAISKIEQQFKPINNNR